MVENDHPEKIELLSDVFSERKHAVYVGLTGSPAPETVAMASAALAGAVLLALPSSSSYFRRRAD